MPSPNLSEPRDANYQPEQNVVWVPGTGLVLIQGGTVLTDAQTGTQYAPMITQAGSVSAPGVVRLEDGQSTLLANIVAYHAGDNQNVGGSGGSMLTAGVAQLLNVLGNADRQRNVSYDGQPALGIATGAASFAQYFTTYSTAGSITAGAASATLTPNTMNGIVVGNVLTLTTTSGTASEQVYVTATTSTTASVVPANGSPAAPSFKNSYSGAYSIAGFLYNIERDASGELDGASGKGTNVAAEYEYLAGGPVLASGLASGLNFDRARNLQGKNMQTSAITSTTAGATSLTFSSAPLALQPGMPLALFNGATNVAANFKEIVYVRQDFVPGAGVTSVPLQNAVINAGSTNAAWESYSPQGPQLNGFLPFGVGIEEECVYDPVTGQFFIERAATQDAMAPQNIVVEVPGLYNGATVDRWRGTTGVADMSSGGRTATSLAAGVTGNTTIKASAGRLARVIVTAPGSVAMNIYDNASGITGTILGALPATTTIGQVFDFSCPAANGITVAGNSGNPGVTITNY